MLERPLISSSSRRRSIPSHGLGQLLIVLAGFCFLVVENAQAVTAPGSLAAFDALFNAAGGAQWTACSKPKGVRFLVSM